MKLEMPLSGDALIELIPQKPPFVLISTLQQVTEVSCTTTFVIDGAHILCDNNVLNPSGLIENIAQTCAAKAGYECALSGKAIGVGFIGDLKDFAYTRLPVAGEEITTEIIVENRVFNVTIISGRIMLGGEEIAHARMKIFSEG